MIVQFKVLSQDIFFFLSQEELDGLEAKIKNTDYFGYCLEAPNKESESYFYLGSSIDKIFKNSKEDEGVQYIFPEEIGDPYLFNLKQKVLTLLQRYKNYVIRLSGGSKLGIVVKDRLK